MQWSDFQAQISHFTDGEQKRIQKAYEIGEKAHTGQIRKSGEPYFTHPIAVALKLLGIGADADTVAAALLHDTVEDTTVTLADIERDFGPAVAALVDGVTKLNQEEISSRPLVDEKIESLRKIFTLMEEDIRIMVMKLADRLHNMQTLGFREKEKQVKVAKETLEVFVPIADRLCMRDWRDELEVLCYDILEPELNVTLQKLQEENMKDAEVATAEIQSMLKANYPTSKVHIHPGRKSHAGLSLQFDLDQKTDKLPPDVAMIFICDTIDDCYLMLGHLHFLWQREVLTFDDFINQPAINGYEGVHTTIILESGMRVRCKIRTQEMDSYAHNGIATKCFEANAGGVLNFLPWTKRISSLSHDTKNRSQEFWESLRSDILSESITVYGPGGRWVSIPKGSTTLDAVLSLFQDRAFFQTSIRVDGKQASPVQRIDHASTVEITTADRPTVNREWLYWVHTGLGIAMIREELSKESEVNMGEVGRTILQQALSERGAGYIEEFGPMVLRDTALSLGYESLEEAYIAIASRHLDAADVIDVLLPASKNIKKPMQEQKEECTFFFSIDRDVESLRKLLSVYDNYNITMQHIRVRLSTGPTLRLKVNVSLTPTAQDEFKEELLGAGAHSVSMKQSTKRELTLMLVVVLCWSLNPVWARWLIESGVAPVALVALRSIFFFCFSLLFYVTWRFLRGKKYSPVPNITLLALAPALSTFALALLTYLSISQLPPSIHLTILRFNVILLPGIHYLLHKNGNRHIMALLLGFVVVLPVFIFSFIPGVSDKGLTFALSALVMYVVYSLVTEHTLQTNKIGVRYPSFLFQMGLILGIIGLTFSPWLMVHMDMWAHLLPTILWYVLVCVFIPHTCFHIILQRIRFTHVTSLSLIEVPLAMLLEMLLLGLFLPPFAYAVIGLSLAGFVLLLQRKLIK